MSNAQQQQGNRARRSVSPDDVGEAITAPRPQREIYEYEIPEELAPYAAVTPQGAPPTYGPFKTIGMKLLTPLEEKTGAARCNGDPMRLAYELSLVSLAEINGRAVQGHDGSQERAYFEMHPKIRALVMQAYSELSVPEESASQSFLKSRRVKA